MEIAPEKGGIPPKKLREMIFKLLKSVLKFM